MRTPQDRSAAAAKLRPGEGVELAVREHAFVDVNGQTVVRIDLNLIDAPVPDRRYVADVCAIECKGVATRLLFGQQKVGGSELRSLVIVRMFPEDVHMFVQSLDGMKDPSIDQIAATRAIRPSILDVSEVTEPSQTVELAANMTAVAVSGVGACLDFFNASPFVRLRAASSGKMAVEPIVRVECQTAHLLALRDSLQRALPGLRAAFPFEVMQ